MSLFEEQYPDPETKALRIYGMANKIWAEGMARKAGTGFSSYRRLKGNQTDQLPYKVHDYLTGEWAISSISAFMKLETPRLILQGLREGKFKSGEFHRAQSCWLVGRLRLFGEEYAKLPKDCEYLTTIEEEPKMDNKVNADRNEMIALIQGAKGMQFAKVVTQFSRLEDAAGEGDNPRTLRQGPALTYKALNLDLKVGDIVVTQYRERFGIGSVVKIYEEAPTSNEYDYSNPLRYVLSKIDVDLSERLSALDNSMLKKITASEAQDRLERLTRQLGMDLSAITLELPPSAGEGGAE